MSNSSLLKEIIELPKNDPKFIEKCNLFAKRIDNRQYFISNLITDFGSLLSSDVIKEREKGILILSSILTRISPYILNSQQIHHICNFYAERLNDNHQVIPSVIQGLIPLVSFHETPNGVSVTLFRSLTQHVPCQQQTQSDRLTIYKFLRALLDKRKAEMEAMGSDFPYGVITLIDGERDPRNLLFLFNWLQTFLTTIKFRYMEEEMFDVFSCYFPVDFRTTNEENCVTRDALASALCPCLCAVDEFVDLCIPLALEKLNSELHRAKSDSLDVLIEACKTFYSYRYKKYLPELWSTLQKEVFTATNNELKEKCLRAITCIIKRISEERAGLIDNSTYVVENFKGNLTPDNELFSPSIEILKAAANAAYKCSELLFNKYSPILINIFNITTTLFHKAKVFEGLVDLTAIYLSKCETERDIKISDVDSVFTICLKGMTSTDHEVQISSIDGLSHLSKFLPASIRTHVYQNLSVLLFAEQNPSILKSILICLKESARYFPHEIEDIIKNMQNNSIESHKTYLQAIGVIAKHARSFSVSVLLDNISSSFDRSMMATQILYDLIEEDNSFLTVPVDTVDTVDKIIDCLLQKLDEFDLELHEKFLYKFAKILNITVRNVYQVNQERILEKQLNKLPLVSKPTEVKIIVYFGILTSLRNNTKFPPQFIVAQIVEVILTTNFEYISLLGSQTLANVLHKVRDEELLIRLLDFIKSQCSKYLQTNQKNVCNVVVFITKALLISDDSNSDAWVKHLLEISATNLNAARSFGIILDDNFDCLNSNSFCTRRMFYKQKFFVKMTTYIVDNYCEKNDYLLVILGCMLPHVSQQILQNELKKIIRLVLLCIGYCEESLVLEGVLTTMNMTIANKEEIIQDYVQEFLKYYLKLTSFERSMNVRILALKGVQIFSTFPLYKVLPLKQDVLIQLGNCLDDKKRLVRKEAVEARSKWFLIDAPI